MVKFLMRHLTSTPLLGLWFSKGTNYTLVEHSDSDFIGCKLDRKILVIRVISLENHLSPGMTRNYQVVHYPQLKQNMSLWEVVLHMFTR